MTIPIIFTIDPTTDNKSNEELVNDFNRAYQGIYHVEAQWVAGTTAEYRTMIKQLNVTGELPAILTDVCVLPSFYHLLVKDRRLTDLLPYMEEDEEWQSLLAPEILEACTDRDGGIYFSTLGTASFSGAGIFITKNCFGKRGSNSSRTHGRNFIPAVMYWRSMGSHRLACTRRGRRGRLCYWPQQSWGRQKKGVCFSGTSCRRNLTAYAAALWQRACLRCFNIPQTMP